MWTHKWPGGGESKYRVVGEEDKVFLEDSGLCGGQYSVLAPIAASDTPRQEQPVSKCPPAQG
jgi:hypothetical protein